MNAVSPNAKFKSPKQVALEYSFSRSKVQDLINEGKIVARRAGGRLIIDAESVDAYIESCPIVEPKATKAEVPPEARPGDGMKAFNELRQKALKTDLFA